ncbi:MAG TPA: cation:proton antiporter [Fimbriimonas sp.]
MLGMFGVVILISGLLSGFIERSNFPQVAVFLALGTIIGPYGLGLADFGLDSPVLRAVATLSLTLVLFTDALTLDLEEVKRHAGLAALILVPGTLLATGLIGFAAGATLGLALPMAAILAAPLASTDPVLLRGLLRRSDLPSAARLALRLESGLNDVVLLPIVLLAMAVLMPRGESDSFVVLVAKMLIVGPGVGALVAWAGIRLLEAMRSRLGVRRDYESLYSIGIALAAFAAAESVHSSGYLAAFAAGVTIAAIDVELCDCFREYGETTAEMLLLFTFVLLGTSLMWAGLSNVNYPLLAFAFLALLARPLTLLAALWRTRTDARSKRLIIWYGPRGLSTLLLILVPVFAEVPGADRLFHFATVVVLLSILVHGGSIMLSGNRARRRSGAVEREDAASGPGPEPGPEAMTPGELARLMATEDNVWLLDVRSERSYLDSPDQLAGSVRLHPQFAHREAVQQGVPKDAWAALFCT